MYPKQSVARVQTGRPAPRGPARRRRAIEASAGAERMGEGLVVEVPSRPGRRRPARCLKTSSAATKDGARGSTDPPIGTQAMASEALIRRQQAGGEIRDVLRERRPCFVREIFLHFLSLIKSIK